MIIPGSSSTSGSPAPSTAAPKAYQAVIRPAAGRTLPPGIASVDQWGATLCELPKFKAKQWSYTEMVTAAFGDPEVMTYLTKFILRHNGPSPKVKDLRAYLEYIDFPKNAMGRIPEGTYVMPRKFKS